MLEATIVPSSDAAYIGRFAPSPTGPLHFGSLLGALASYLDARANKGSWLVRIEDIDPPREIPGASELILKTLEQYHLFWDGDILYQSSRLKNYADTVTQLINKGLAYTCSCSRKQIRLSGSVYPGFCRHKNLATDSIYPIRLKVPQQVIRFDDAIQGQQQENLSAETGDFIIQRRDHFAAYQLAVVVDDHFQNISHVVRGSDLQSSTARQMHLQQLLQFPCPQYAHIPIIVDEQNCKLSKQTFATPLNGKNAKQDIIRALYALGQQPPPELIDEATENIIKWAIGNWQLGNIPKQQQLPESSLPKLIDY